MKNIYLIILYSFSFLTVFAQSIDSIPIKQEISTVFVTAYSIDTLRYLDKETTFKLEANEKMTFNTLENVLDNQSNISLKKYGEGQISTISVKGFNASQTNVVWNGVNINSPLLGQADMSTVSIGNNTSLKLQENNNDNIAGQVSLKNNFDYRKKQQLNVMSSATSFGSFNQGVSFEFSKKRKVYSNSNASLSYNLNKYKYLNKSLANQEETYLKNAETMSFHFEQINGFKLKKNNEIRLFFKAFYADRNIAPTIYEFSSTKNQKDQLYLAKLEWQKSDFQKNYELIISHSFVNQIQSVKLSKTSTAIKYGSYSMQSNIWFYKKLLKNFYFDFNINNILENGFSNNYNEAIWRNKLYLKPSLKYLFFKNLALKFSIAEIIVNSKLSQPLPAIEIKYAQKHLPASIMLQFDYSRKAHFPSLNDLYWNPGGNINLKEEYAHNFNFNFIVQRNFKPFKNNHKFYFRNKIEIFNIYSENYIQWEPTEQGFWEPNNIGKVYSRGFTNDLTLKYTFDKNWYIQNIFSYNLTRITKLKETEQLIYAPINSITNGTNIQTKWFNILVNQQFVSEKYTNYNNTLSLDKYYLLDLILSKEFKLNNSHKLYIAFEANNLLNETYFTYINRALPKRNFAIKLKYTFQ